MFHFNFFVCLCRELSEQVNRIANLFLSYGIKKGDIVAIYMPMCPTTVAVMLACSRIGAVHSIVFAGFSSQALASRIQVSFWFPNFVTYIIVNLVTYIVSCRGELQLEDLVQGSPLWVPLTLRLAFLLCSLKNSRVLKLKKTLYFGIGSAISPAVGGG